MTGVNFKISARILARPDYWTRLERDVGEAERLSMAEANGLPNGSQWLGQDKDCSEN